MDSTETPRQLKPRRRRRSRPRRTCQREGCDRGVRAGHDCCCFLCDVVNQELKRAQRVCEASGGYTEHCLAVVSLNDALTEYYRNDLRIYRAALESGFTDEQWQVIKRGR
jgi:hypothetical protein